MKKVAIVYGEIKNALQGRAVEEMSKLLREYLGEYPICVACDGTEQLDGYRCVYVGTRESNPYIAKNPASELSLPESYRISVKDDTVTVEGYDDAGALYGVLDFYNKYVIAYGHKKAVRDSNINRTNLWEREALVDFELVSAPSVAERGLWTWGHVIYDYRDYLYNMMLLKMNSVIIWNDFVPANAREVVEYAHSCNIKVYWGFTWLWGTGVQFDIRHLEDEPQKILQKYEREYANSEGDGIYFQTFTEHKTDRIDGVLIAEAAAKFVNDTVSLFYEKYPDLKIQFGLHGTSVDNRLEFIRTVNPKVEIIWEDLGAFPFAYDPHEVSNFEQTVELVERVANLRGENDLFGVVTKGLVNLDWSTFKHLEGSQFIGVSDKATKQSQINAMAHQWRYVQAGWLINSDRAREMIQKMCRIKNGKLSVFALVEDGVFEENIMFPVALYSEILWDCNNSMRNLTKYVALRKYVKFA